MPLSHDRVVDQNAWYSGEVFSALAQNWNEQMLVEHPHESLVMKPALSMQASFAQDPVETVVLSDVRSYESHKPFKLLYPLLEGANHWVGVVVECNEAGKITIVANDPLGEAAGPRRARVDKALSDIKTSLTGVYGAANISTKRDSSAFTQNDTMACGPYVFENMTAYATGSRRAENPGRMQLRTEQMDRVQADNPFIKETSFSKDVDQTLKEYGQLAFESGLHDSSAIKDVFADQLSGSRFSGHEKEQILNRIIFHAQHDDDGLRYDVLMAAVENIGNVVQEYGAEAAGIGEFIDDLRTNQDVNKLPPEVLDLLSEPANYSKSDLKELLEEKFVVRAASPALGVDERVPSPSTPLPFAVETEQCLNHLAIALLSSGVEKTDEVIPAIIANLERGEVIEDIVLQLQAEHNIQDATNLTKQVEKLAELNSNPVAKMLIESLNAGTTLHHMGLKGGHASPSVVVPQAVAVTSPAGQSRSR